MKTIKTASLIIILSATSCVFSTCQNFINKYRNLTGFTQGTTYSIKYKDALGRNFQKEIDEQLHQFDLLFSAYIYESAISKINRNEPIEQLDDKFLYVLNVAREVNRNTGGAFDITVGPLVNAWGFGWEHNNENKVNVDSLLTLVGMDKLTVNNKQLIKENPGIKIDVNAIAQGYSADIIAELFENKGIDNYMVEIGGEVVAKGVNPKGIYWKIGIDKPVENNLVSDRQIQAVVSMKNNALATSGNYRKFYEKDGIKYAHSINPETGYPVLSNLLSATVLAKDCITADAYATAFMVMGLDKTLEFLENNDFLEAYLIYSDDEGNFKTFQTKYFKENSYLYK